MGDTIDKADAWDAVVKARAEGIAQGRAEGFRAGAEAMKRLAVETVRRRNLPFKHRDLDVEVRALPIPEEQNNG